jgi:hypothetical protein
MEGHLFLCISRELIKYNLQTYNNSPKDQRIAVINNIVFGKKRKIVATFKDNLVYNDTKDFIKK